MQNSAIKGNSNIIYILFLLAVFLFIIGFICLLSYDLYNTKKINNDLKNELYVTKNDLKELRKNNPVTVVKCMERD